jgi:hypothetical protein
VSLWAKIVPRGIRKLTWKKVGKAAKVALPIAGALLIPGVGGAIVKGATAAAGLAGKVAKTAGGVVSGVAKAGSSAVGEIAGAVEGAAGDVGGAVSDSAGVLDRVERRIQDEALAADRALGGGLLNLKFPIDLGKATTPILLGAAALVLFLLLRKGKR